MHGTYPGLMTAAPAAARYAPCYPVAVAVPLAQALPPVKEGEETDNALADDEAPQMVSMEEGRSE